jgi:hypothetical protein
VMAIGRMAASPVRKVRVIPFTGASSESLSVVTGTGVRAHFTGS